MSNELIHHIVEKNSKHLFWILKAETHINIIKIFNMSIIS